MMSAFEVIEGGQSKLGLAPSPSGRNEEKKKSGPNTLNTLFYLIEDVGFRVLEI